MMKGKINIFFMLLFISAGCDKNLHYDNTRNRVESMGELWVPDEFNWSASVKGILAVDFENPGNVSLNGEMLYIINDRDEVIDKKLVSNGKVLFQTIIPSNEQYWLYFPVSETKQLITGTGSYTMNLGSKKSLRSYLYSGGYGSCTDCDTPVVNGGFEYPSYVNHAIVNQSVIPGWSTTDKYGWMEFWADGHGGVAAQEGSQYIELNCATYSTWYQSLCLVPGSTICWSVWYRGRSGVDIAHVKIGAFPESLIFQQEMVADNSEWLNYRGVYTVPEGQTSTIVGFESIEAAGGPTSGCFLDNFQIGCDGDGDGGPVQDDDYPDDTERAYKSFYPASGVEILAFEDLWPWKGDYDFNDLVLSHRVEIARNAENELVDARFTVSVNALGGSLRNGLALLIRDNSGDMLMKETVGSYSGDIIKDPDNPNGFIISNDVIGSLPQFYQNNGSGPSETPDTLRFTLNFIPGISMAFIPELYIFRSDERGREIHRPEFGGSLAFDSDLTFTGDDNGNFKTESNLPWALQIIINDNFRHPLEKVDIVKAYPEFQNWAASGGQEATDWYLSPASGKVYELSTK